MSWGIILALELIKHKKSQQINQVKTFKRIGGASRLKAPTTGKIKVNYA